MKSQLLFGDCLELMPNIPDQSIDMVLCDLPYGTTACAWDKRLSLDRLWAQYKRLITTNGVIVLTASQPFTSQLIDSNPKWFKYEWIWVKNHSTGFQHARNMPLKNHENILVFSKASMGHQRLLKNNRMNYYPQGLVRVNKLLKTGDKKFGNAIGKRPSHKDTFIREFSNYPLSVLYFQAEKGLHPTQKPVPLFQYMVESYTQPGATVLDNCAGSGTTGIACINAGRNYILMENDPAIFPVMENRVSDHLINQIKKS